MKILLIIPDHKKVKFPSKFLEKIYSRFILHKHNLISQKIKKYVIKNKDNITVITMGDSFNKFLSENKIEFKPYNSYVKHEDFFGIESEARKMLDSSEKLFDSTSYEKLKFKGISIWKVLDLFLLTNLREKMKEIKSIKKILSFEHPDKVIIFNASDSDRLFFREVIPETVSLTFQSNSFVKSLEDFLKFNFAPKFLFKRKIEKKKILYSKFLL